MCMLQKYLSLNRNTNYNYSFHIEHYTYYRFFLDECAYFVSVRNTIFGYVGCLYQYLTLNIRI